MTHEKKRRGSEILDEIRAEIDAKPKPDLSQELGGVTLWANANCPAPQRPDEKAPVLPETT
jgi:hypothetical protein